MKPLATKYGPDITVWIASDDGIVRVPIGTATNLPDAKLKARGAVTKLQYALDRVNMADVADVQETR